jgi:outer membrane cobalamin receptor
MISYRTAILIAILTPVINSQAARADDTGTSLSETIVTATRVAEPADTGAGTGDRD